MGYPLLPVLLLGGFRLLPHLPAHFPLGVLLAVVFRLPCRLLPPLFFQLCFDGCALGSPACTFGLACRLALAPFVFGFLCGKGASAEVLTVHSHLAAALGGVFVVGAEGGKGERIARLSTRTHATLNEALHAVGHTPLPPYIKSYAGDEEMYQTVYSTTEKSAAAPTAGLHFTPELIERIKQKGAFFETVELQVGIDTFRIVDEEDPTKHKMHTETYTVPQHVVDACNQAHARGNRVIAVGTTSVRSLESAWDQEAGELRAREEDKTSLFLFPGSTFHVVDALITNFHVPRSTLMMLVSAFSSRDMVMEAYKHAIESEYRMLSFGDAMFIH